MKPDDFWRMTFTEVDVTCKGYEIRMAKMREVERLTATAIMNANRDTKKYPHGWSPQDIFPLYTDNKQKGADKYLTKEEYEDMIEMRKKVIWQKNSQRN